jgi:hypothetical protein
MKQIAIITCMLISMTAFGFSPLEYYNVTANAGLNLRATPGNGTVLKTLQLGDRVEILEDLDSLGYAQTIDYVPGNWIKVSHNGTTGYVFSGYLSRLPAPLNANEYSTYLSVSQSFRNYLQNNFTVEATNYNIIGSTIGEVEEYYEGGAILKKVDTEYDSFIYSQIPDTQIFEIYHVLSAMLSDVEDRDAFLGNTTFVKNRKGDIDKIKVNTGSELITIVQVNDGRVRLEMSSFFGC